MNRVQPTPREEGAERKVAGHDVAELVPSFVDMLVSGEQQKVYDFIRTMTAGGVSSETFIMAVVRKLDDIYKNRLEGNHNPDPVLAARTATWTNGDFEKVLGILVESIDFSYSSSRIGTKVAIAKAFEYFSHKQK